LELAYATGACVFRAPGAHCLFRRTLDVWRSVEVGFAGAEVNDVGA
jgi:hypothetical protein